MRTEIILTGVLIISNTFGAPHRNKDFIPEIYSTGTSLINKDGQNAKENPSNTYTVRQAPNQPVISVNQQSDFPIQPVLYNQPTNQQAILVTGQPNQQPILIHQNPNQQTIVLTNLKPQPILVAQPNQQSKINQPETQPENQPIAQLVFIQQPIQQQTTWNPSQPPKQAIENPPTNKNPNVPIIFVTLPYQQTGTGNQQTEKRISPSELPSKQTMQQHDPQQFLFASSQTKPQPNQQGTSQVYQYISADQSAQKPSIWMASQPNQPNVLAQLPNRPASNQLGQPKTVNVGQPAYVSPGTQPMIGKLIDGNIVIIPFEGL